MDDVKAMTRAGETVGKAVGSGWRSARGSAKRAGQAGAGVTSRAAEALAEGAEAARQEVVRTTRRARRKLAKKAKSTRKDLAKAAKQARKDAARSKPAKRARKSAKQAKVDAKKLRSQLKVEAAKLKTRAHEEAAALKLVDPPKRKRRWTKFLLLAIVAGGVAFVVRSKAASQQAVPEPRTDEQAKPETTTPADGAANAARNGQPQKSPSSKSS
jgi:hypothetical protein